MSCSLERKYLPSPNGDAARETFGLSTVAVMVTSVAARADASQLACMVQKTTLALKFLLQTLGLVL